MRIEELCEQYVLTHVFNEETAIAIRRVTKLFIERSEVSELHSVNMQALGTFKNKCLTACQPVTYNGYLKYLRLLGDFAVAQQYTTNNVFRALPLAPVGKPPAKTYKPDQINALKQWICENKKVLEPWWFWLGVIQTLQYTGMRRRQLVNLQFKHLDFVNRQILLSYQSSKTKREWYIPMHPELEVALKEYLVHFKENTDAPMHKNDYVFSIYRFNSRYKHQSPFDQMEPSQITGYFRRLSNKLEFSAGAHRFRHTLATILCNPEDGGPPDIFAAQDILGHSKLETTRGYVSTDIRRMEAALRRLNQKVTSVKTERKRPLNPSCTNPHTL